MVLFSFHNARSRTSKEYFTGVLSTPKRRKFFEDPSEHNEQQVIAFHKFCIHNVFRSYIDEYRTVKTYRLVTLVIMSFPWYLEAGNQFKCFHSLVTTPTKCIAGSNLPRRKHTSNSNWGGVTHIFVSKLIIIGLNSAKPLSEPLLEYC